MEAAIGYTIGAEISVTDECTIDVPAGEKGKIIFRGKYQKYTADQVLYRTCLGTPQQELKREKVEIYVPVAIAFKGVPY